MATNNQEHVCPEGTWYLSEDGSIYAVHPDNSTHPVGN